MNKSTKWIVGLVFLALITWQGISYAQTAFMERLGGVTATGVTSLISTAKGGTVAVKEAIVAFQENPGTATVSYNIANGSAATDGWINVADFNDDIIWNIDVEQLQSTGIDATFEGLISDDSTSPILLFTKSFTGTDTSYSLSIAEGALKYVRLGLQATGTPGTDIVDAKLRAEGALK